MEIYRKKEGPVLIICVMIMSLLLGCTPAGISAVPTFSSPVTDLPDTKPAPIITAVPLTTTPFQSDLFTATSSPATTTASITVQFLPSATTFSLCKEGEYEAAYDQLVPYGDQLLFLTHEVGRMEELSRQRAEEILRIVKEIGSELEIISVPNCMLPAYDSLVEASLLLERGILSFLDGDEDLALDQIKETLLFITEVVQNFVIMSWELTATSTPEK